LLPAFQNDVYNGAHTKGPALETSHSKNVPSLKVPVLDLVSQVHDVVLVRCIFSSGKPQGVGILEWGVYGEGMEMGRSVYEQPGTKVDGILSQQGGFQVSRRETKGSKKKWEKEKTEARGLQRNYVVC
jgi:hypothetical protein